MKTWVRLCALSLILLHLAHARIWSIQMGFQYGGHEYFDANGYHKGFGVDLIDRVCAEGGMDCRIVIDAYVNCWQANKGSHPSPGSGLISRRYDACMGWFVTTIRIHSFAFSHPYLKQHTNYFYVLKGAHFNPDDLAGRKIAFAAASSGDAPCLARQSGIANNVLEDWQIIHKPDKLPLIQALQANEADAIFGDDNYWTLEQMKLLDKVPKEMSCSLDGNALMARKDSGIIAAWNIGFSKLRATNGYAKFCQEFVPKHAHKGIVPCLDM